MEILDTFLEAFYWDYNIFCLFRHFVFLAEKMWSEGQKSKADVSLKHSIILSEYIIGSMRKLEFVFHQISLFSELSLWEDLLWSLRQSYQNKKC